MQIGDIIKENLRHRRLSEDGTKTVLLLEAGGEDTQTDIAIPGKYKISIICAGAVAKLQLSEVDWQYKSQKHEATSNRVHNWPRGKV